MLRSRLAGSGRAALSALPALRIALKDDRRSNKAALAHAILKLDPSSLSEIDGIINSVDDFGTRAALFALLRRESPDGLGLARKQLRAIEGEMSRLDGIRAGSVSFVESAIYELSGLGPSANAALTVLYNLQDETCPFIRLAAERAIGEINGTTAVGFGLRTGNYCRLP